jgi:hypothetical protein
MTGQTGAGWWVRTALPPSPNDHFAHEGLVSENIFSISLVYCRGAGIRIFVMYSDNSLFFLDNMQYSIIWLIGKFAFGARFIMLSLPPLGSV